MGNSSRDLTGILQESFKKYQEMEEALAERLLDLHCRLVSLYILQDADCLDWENTDPFFEMERGSYIIQMWWLYMKGTVWKLCSICEEIEFTTHFAMIFKIS